jgi:hypothetical protein
MQHKVALPVQTYRHSVVYSLPAAPEFLYAEPRLLSHSQLRDYLIAWSSFQPCALAIETQHQQNNRAP